MRRAFDHFLGCVADASPHIHPTELSFYRWSNIFNAVFLGDRRTVPLPAVKYLPIVPDPLLQVLELPLSEENNTSSYYIYGLSSTISAVTSEVQDTGGVSDRQSTYHPLTSDGCQYAIQLRPHCSGTPGIQDTGQRKLTKPFFGSDRSGILQNLIRLQAKYCN